MVMRNFNKVPYFQLSCWNISVWHYSLLEKKHSWYCIKVFSESPSTIVHISWCHLFRAYHTFLGMAVSFQCPFYDHFLISNNVKVFIRMCFFSKPGIKIHRSCKTEFLRFWGLSWTRRNFKTKGVTRLNFPQTCYGASIVVLINKYRKIKGLCITGVSAPGGHSHIGSY